MSDWRERLADVDDDYLVGLSNKGIVKRAYKDKGEVDAEVQDTGEEASVKVGEETVTVRYPLAESKCSCPSRSICRHVVQAILVLREHYLNSAAAESEAAGDMGAAAQERADREDGATAEAGTAGSGSTTAEAGPDSGSGAAVETGTVGNGRAAGTWKEINAYPLEKLKKVLGIRQFQTFVNQVAAAVRPQIQSTSVVTVQLPQQGYVVKLLSPLEYSTCSCHKKELCVHKAAAILWCQLEAGILTKEMLLGEMVETQEYDLEHVKEAAGQMKAFLEELFATGLSRTSPDVLNYLERLAIISHNEGLARFEGYFRALSDSYDRYFARKAAFQTQDLMAQIARLYRRVELLGQAEEAKTVAGLAGEFRADYIPVGNLDLIGISMEHFESQTGYEGDTVYFLEENTKKWYTYTNARPVFYDSRKRRGYVEKSPSPWGLNIAIEDMLKVRIHLTGAKCDERNRLSSSQETKGEVTGSRGLSAADIRDWYYQDFDKLFTGQIGKQQRAWLAGSGSSSAGNALENGDSPGEGQEGSAAKGVELVFVQPDSCAKAEFSQTGQQLTLPIYDKAGRELLVEVTYSKQESGTIRYLERIAERKVPCFLGKVYLKDGRVRMYPVDVLEIEAPFETAGDQGDGQERGPEREENWQEIQNAAFAGRKTKYEVMEDLTAEILSLMEDLYQSGFDTVHDSTLKDIRKTGELTAQYGMQYLSELLSGMAEEITLSRHRMEKKTASLAQIYTKVNEYLYLCRQKTAYDRGENYYMS